MQIFVRLCARKKLRETSSIALHSRPMAELLRTFPIAATRHDKGIKNAVACTQTPAAPWWLPCSSLADACAVFSPSEIEPKRGCSGYLHRERKHIAVRWQKTCLESMTVFPSIGGPLPSGHDPYVSRFCSAGCDQ